MADRKLISPKFRAIIGDMELSDGITAECYSSVTERCNYATIELNKRLIGSVEVSDRMQKSSLAMQMTLIPLFPAM